MDLLTISPLSWESLLCCFLAAFFIGLERQLQGKPVGVRTRSVMCIVTSASAILILAAIGVIVGLGHPWLGVKMAILTVVILVGVNRLEDTFEFMQRGVHHKLKKRQGAQTPNGSSPAEQSSE